MSPYMVSLRTLGSGLFCLLKYFFVSFVEMGDTSWMLSKLERNLLQVPFLFVSAI